MKVLQLVAGDSMGGVGKHVIELTNALSDEESLTVIADNSYKNMFDCRVQFLEFDVGQAKSNPFFLWRLYQLVKNVSPDIVHAHGNKASLILARLQFFLRVKTIGTIHWELKKNKDRRIFNRLDAVIGVTDKVLEGVCNPHQYIVHNGVSGTSSSRNIEDIRADFKLELGRPIAIAVGRMVKVKGFDILLHAWHNIDAYLLLVGDGPELHDLQRLSERLDISDRVRFTGYIDNAQSLFFACDLIVVASLHEGFGYVLAEALMLKKPIISTAVTFARQVMPGKYLAEPGNIQSLNKCLSYAVENLEILNQDLHKAYEWAADNLTVKKMAVNTSNCYRQFQASDRG